ncbi:protein YqbG [Domibacillus robiginosus]|uniref:protein YqbG n=1 Tax=Domibacillus robiginosus TaxID=1071054 RepID=UPI00067CF8C9|nr:DUF3199 family protein [Domibacillus robiginosus]
MLITSEELVNYTAFDEVKNWEVDLLELDILEAEVEVKGIVGHDFTDEAYQPLPQAARLAIHKLAQYFALVNSGESLTKGIKSEKIGDYSYTVSGIGGNKMPDVLNLLKPFIKKEEPADPGNIQVRMRVL